MFLGKNFDFWLEWISTTLLIIGSILSAYNIYPLNIVMSMLGNIGWVWCGFRMKKPSLWFVSIILTAIYFSGIVVKVL